MSLRGTLTNECLIQQFRNPFVLVEHAITLAQEAVARGEGTQMYLASEVLEEIALENRPSLESDDMDE